MSQYTKRVHLCTCDNGEDSVPRSLSENFRLEEISADCSEWASFFVKENPACQHAIVSFSKEWKNLKRIEQKKLLGKPLQLPLAIELLRLCESNNHDSNVCSMAMHLHILFRLLSEPLFKNFMSI